MQVRLMDKMGSDLTVVNAARVSFAKESEWESIPEGGEIEGLLSLCLLYTSPSPRDPSISRMPSSA